MPAPARRTLGPLEALVVEGAPEAPAVVLFHGYGADAADLAPLASALGLNSRPTWVFPEGPLSLGPAGWPGARAWFPIDEQSLERAQFTGKPMDLAKSGAGAPEHFARASALAREALGALKIPWSRLILGGFSQGAMMATDLALRAQTAPLGLAILSGAFIGSAHWEPLAPGRAGLPFFQSHGTADALLSFDNARKLESFLQKAGLQGELLPFDGGHGIGPEAAEGLARFLETLVSQAGAQRP